jgi:hypothetical protein
MRKPLTLLLRHTDGSAAATGGLRVLTTDAEAPVVTETTVSADLLEALEVVTELGVDTVGEHLAVFAVDDIALPVQEPAGDLVCAKLEGDHGCSSGATYTAEGSGGW